MSLHDIHRGITKNKKRKRLGRGPGTGQGKTAGRGHKGQKARAGYKALSIFEGGAMPVVRRVPKRGFTNSFALTVATVNVSDLERVFDAGAEVTPETLRDKSLAKSRYDVLKVLGNGELTKKLKVSAHRFSKSAEEKIKSAGGEVHLLPGRTPLRKQKQASGSDKSAGKSAG